MQYKHSMIRLTSELIDSIMIFNFSKHKAMAKWLRVKPIAENLFKELDNSGEENLKNLAIKYQGLVEAARQDGLI